MGGLGNHTYWHGALKQEAFVGNAKRRAWVRRVMSDPRQTDIDRRLAQAVAGMDGRGVVFCRVDGEFFFEPRAQFAERLAAY